MLSKGKAGEGENIFGNASMTGIAVSFFVKSHEGKKDSCKIRYCDIGNDLRRKEKLDRLRLHGSINAMMDQNLFASVEPDEHSDWIKQRDDSAQNYSIIGDKSAVEKRVIFGVFTSGVNTARDAWCYNFSKSKLLSNIRHTVSFYNAEVARFAEQEPSRRSTVDVDRFIQTDPKLISWGTNLKAGVKAGRVIDVRTESARVSLYRPFTKQWLYFDKTRVRTH